MSFQNWRHAAEMFLWKRNPGTNTCLQMMYSIQTYDTMTDVNIDIWMQFCSQRDNIELHFNIPVIRSM